MNVPFPDTHNDAIVSPNLCFPLLAPAQALKHITVNEALCALDAVSQIVIARADLQIPPPSPEIHARYLVGDGASGTWSGHDGDIAQWTDTGWRFLEPREGWVLWDRSDAALLARMEAGWVRVGGAEGPERTQRLGINASADDTNRLAVAADATILSHDGADHRLSINRAGPDDTASLLFQTDYSADAEVGLTGADGLSVKVLTPEGWRNALSIDRDTAAVILPHSGFVQGGASNLFPDGGAFMGAPQPGGVGGDPFVVPGWISLQNGAAVARGETFHYNSQTNGGTAAVNGPAAQALAALTLSSAQHRYSRGFHTARVTAGTGAGLSATFGDGTTRHLSLIRLSTVVPLQMTYSVYILAETGAVACLIDDTTRVTLDGTSVQDELQVPTDGAWHHIIIHTDPEPQNHVRRDTRSMRFYSLPGETFQVGFPAAMAGIHGLGPKAGQIPSLHGFAG